MLAAARWAQAVQAADRVRVARIGAEETRRQIAIATSEAYLRIIALKREVEVNELARANAQAHLDYAHTRLEAGAGSRLNEIRAAQELETVEVLLEGARLAVRRSQEALGILLAADAPIDVAGEPIFEEPRSPTMRGSPAARTSGSSTAQVDAAERVARDSWKDWVPVGTASFQPQFLTPDGIFQPSGTWSVVAQFAVPIFDGGVRQAAAKERRRLAETARLELTDGQLRARSEQRIAQAAVESRSAGWRAPGWRRSTPTKPSESRTSRFGPARPPTSK